MFFWHLIYVHLIYITCAILRPYNQGSIRHLFIVAYRPLSTKLIADLLLLFGLCIKETDKLIKISKNVIQLRITLLNYNGYVIINFFISKNRNLDTKTISFIEFVKPSGKKASSHSLSAITRFTLI